ncbi:hypothetical protein J7384_18825 [Endozoicomonas sp. G2_1]|uniref:hypothetical protein n=1 Tax=Endozoicomonas sp. G2_1 TaxID=2821091 RepID=UPI001ADC30BC|nr:hypothetical protein [Endozoicomonas sp. G2_1]MBO9492423.1 hypothetical protein [Endozoicomonas sp. G2_1]
MNYINAGNIWIGLLLLLLLYVIKKSPIKVLAYLDEKKLKNFEQANLLLESEAIGDEYKQFIKEELERAIFKKYAGISTDRKTRKILCEFYETHKDTFLWDQIRWAYKYMVFDGNEVSIKISPFSNIGRWIVTVYSWMIAIVGLTVLAIGVFYMHSDYLQLIGYSILGAFLIFMGLLFSSMNFSYHNAVKIKKYLKNL